MPIPAFAMIIVGFVGGLLAMTTVNFYKWYLKNHELIYQQLQIILKKIF